MQKQIKDIFFIIIGTAIMAIGIGVFVLPYNILSGGIAGITVLLKPFFNISEELIASIVDIGFFLLGWAFLGKGFAKTTFVSVIVYPIAITLVDRYIPPVDVDPLLASLYGGIIGGTGMGIVMRNGGSTGGTDVPPLIFEKFFRIEVSRGIMVIDGITVILGLWIYGMQEVLLGLICVYFNSIAIDKVMDVYNGARNSRRIEIISNEYEKIINEINIELSRGTTILTGKGGYTSNDKPVVVCVVPEYEFNDVIDIIDKYDRNAFVIVTDVSEVHGEGFTYESRL